MHVLLYFSVKGKLASLKGFAISSSMSALDVSVFLFAVLFDYFLLFTDQTTQHNTSTKCQGYTTDLTACHWHHTSFCIPVIQSNTVPNVNWRGTKKKKYKKVKGIPLWEKDAVEKKKGNIFHRKGVVSILPLVKFTDKTKLDSELPDNWTSKEISSTTIYKYFPSAL